MKTIRMSKKKIVVKSEKSKTNKKNKVAKKADNFFVDDDKNENIIDIFDFAIQEKEQEMFAPNFMKPSNAFEDLDELLDEAEIEKNDRLVVDKRTNIVSIVSDEKKIDPLERMIYDDVIMSETYRAQENFNIKLAGESAEINRSKLVQSKSKHLVNLKKSNINYVDFDNDINLELLQKRTISSVFSFFVKETLRIASQNIFFKTIHFFGEASIRFFYYVILAIFFIPKIIFDLFVEFVSFINYLGKNILSIFVPIKNKTLKDELVDGIVRAKNKVASFEPQAVFEKRYAFNYSKIFGFVFVSLLIVASIHSLTWINKIGDSRGKVLGISEEAYSDFGNGIESISSSNFKDAQNSFGSANTKFSEAQEEIAKYNGLFVEIAKFIPNEGKKLDSGMKLLEVGQLFSDAASHISSALEQTSDASVTDKIKMISNNLKQTRDELMLASQKISEIDEKNIPESYRDKFVTIKENTPIISKNLDQLISLMDVSLEILADDSMKRYLFVFQNTNELRPTGGFMGSIAIVDIKEGEIKNVKVPGGGPYDYKAGFYENVVAPKPLWLINPNWYFWDTMWWSNFPTSSDMMLKYFYKSGGPTVDGVIAINSDVMKDFLKITGPIYLEKYNLEISSDNFTKEVQEIVEFKYDKEKNQPKEIIGDLMQKIMEKVFTDKDIDYLEALKVFENSAEKKDIQMYFTNSYVEESVKKFGWAGEIKDTSRDYLSVINTNIGGGKTDEFVEQKVDHNVNILSNGAVVDTLKINRKYIPQIGNIFSEVPNKNYIRIYVPLGAKIIEASGFEAFPEKNYVNPIIDSKEDEEFNNIEGKYLIDEASGAKINTSFNKTVFSGWQELKPGEEKEIYIKYELPFKLNFNKNKSFISELFFKKDNSLNFDNYSIYYQRQSGAKSTLDTNYTWPENFNLTWSNFETAKNSNIFDRDIMRGFILKNNN